MRRMIFIAWFAPLIFMAVAFYVLFKSDAPAAARIAFTAVPMVIWILGGFAIYREYREQEEKRRKEKEILDEARRILNGSKHPDESRSFGKKASGE